MTGLFKYVALQIKSAGFANLTEGEFSFVKKGILEEYEIDTETRAAQQEWSISETRESNNNNNNNNNNEKGGIGRI